MKEDGGADRIQSAQGDPVMAFSETGEQVLRQVVIQPVDGEPHLGGVVDVVRIDMNQIAGMPAQTMSDSICLRISSRVSFESGWACPKMDSSRSRNDTSSSVVVLFRRISSSALLSWSAVRLRQTCSALLNNSFVIRTMLMRRLEVLKSSSALRELTRARSAPRLEN